MNRFPLYRSAVALLVLVGAGNAAAQVIVSDPVPIEAAPSQSPVVSAPAIEPAETNPVPTAPAPAPPPTHTENFDRKPVDGWEYSCQQRLIAMGDGQALETSGAGHAIWTAAGRLTDFTLSFRYGYEEGVGDVFFRSTDTPAGMEFYCLKLAPSEASLARRLHTRGQGCSEQDLTSAPCSLQPQTWYDVTIRAKGGLVEVWIGDQQVLRYLDPQPLTAGSCGLGVIGGSGAVLYDDVSLAADKAPSHDPRPEQWGYEGRRASSERQ